MIEKNCITQVSIPTVDNTQIECDEITSSKCVVVEKECKKVDNLPGESLDTFVEKLCVKLDLMDKKIVLAGNSGGTTDLENIIRVPSATYSELGITPDSTIEEKQTAIAIFLEGYDNLGTDVLFFEIKDNTEPETNTLKIIDLTN